MTLPTLANDGWETIEPQVNAEAEFLEIARDFGDPLELLREAISNAIDWSAKWIKITFAVEEIEGSKRSVITLFDNGDGMTHEILSRDFWGLGYCPSKKKKDATGEKGHGTKIFLRSELITVRTHSAEGAYLSECSKPLSQLTAKQLHSPRIKPIDKPFEHFGTEIRIVGYSDNDRSKFIFNVIKDYLLWFTKVGSIERVFGIERNSDFKVYLKCLDQEDYEEIPFGHTFPDENSDINKLFEDKEADAADWYVKRYIWKNNRLTIHPEVTFDTVISVEGDEIKREYNKMIAERRGPKQLGKYRMGDRYGIWLCKDYIPIKRVNDWVTGFGSGSNAFVLLHGFVNCQSLRLTANRGDIANEETQIFEELKSSVQKQIDKVDKELGDKGIYTLRNWQEENRTIAQEKAEFGRRVKNLQRRKVARVDGHLFVEPSNEAELCSLLIAVHALHPDLFEFEPLDYNANRGIDIIARNKSDNSITEGDHWYIELKHKLQNRRFNHAFQYLRWIVCWDFEKNISDGCDLQGIEDNDVRQLQTATDNNGHRLYFLDSKKKAGKIQIIRLSEFLKQRLNMDFAE